MLGQSSRIPRSKGFLKRLKVSDLLVIYRLSIIIDLI
jgi:hypothetical protein